MTFLICHSMGWIMKKNANILKRSFLIISVIAMIAAKSQTVESLGKTKN